MFMHGRLVGLFVAVVKAVSNIYSVHLFYFKLYFINNITYNTNSLILHDIRRTTYLSSQPVCESWLPLFTQGKAYCYTTWSFVQPLTSHKVI
jgi:hypothetical protein